MSLQVRLTLNGRAADEAEPEETGERSMFGWYPSPVPRSGGGLWPRGTGGSVVWLLGFTLRVLLSLLLAAFVFVHALFGHMARPHINGR